MMKENKVKKESGCSCIEVTGDLPTFLSKEKAHPTREMILKELNLFYSEMRKIEYSPDGDPFLNIEIG